MGVHGLQPEVEFSNFLALQISNAVSQTLDSNYHNSKVKNGLILNMTPENRSKTFQNWLKATQSTLTPEETIEPNGQFQRENNNNNNKWKKNKIVLPL